MAPQPAGKPWMLRVLPGAQIEDLGNAEYVSSASYPFSFLSSTVSASSASYGPLPPPSSRFRSGPRSQAHHSSALWMFGSTSRGPHATPMSFQADGLAAIASRQRSVSPFDAMPRILLSDMGAPAPKIGTFALNPAHTIEQVHPVIGA